MSEKEKKTYREINGTTRVGDFLRSVGKTDLLKKLLHSGLEIMSGDYVSAVKSLLNNSDELTAEQRVFSLKLLESDVKENEEITKRWKYDLMSDSYWSKNVRPFLLIYLTLSTTVLIVLDSAIKGFEVAEHWVTLLLTLLTTAFLSYFGGRSYVKSKKL